MRGTPALPLATSLSSATLTRSPAVCKQMAETTHWRPAQNQAHLGTQGNILIVSYLTVSLGRVQVPAFFFFKEVRKIDLDYIFDHALGLLEQCLRTTYVGYPALSPTQTHTHTQTRYASLFREQKLTADFLKNFFPFLL